MSYQSLLLALKGSLSSGNYGHAGRPGKRGGSAPNTYGGIVSNTKAFAIHELSKLVDNFYAYIKKTHGPLAERQESAANALGYASYNDYAKDVYEKSTLIEGGSAIGNSLRNEFFGEGYGKSVYESISREDYSGAAGIVKSLANKPMEITRLVRIDSKLSSDLKEGDVFDLGGPKAFTVHDSPGVFSGQKIVVDNAYKGTRVSLYSPYPQEGEVFSESPNGYRIKKVLDDGSYIVEML